MRIIACILFFVMIISCTPNDKSEGNAEAEKNVEETSSESVVEMQQEDLNVIMYTNAQAGLRVRNSPRLDGEITGLLDFGTKVVVAYEDTTIVVIDNIEGRWVSIKSPVEGWVFNGFLTNNIEADADEVSGLNYEIVEHNPRILEHIMHEINRKRSLKDYFHLSGEYFCIEDNTLLRIFSNSLGISRADGRGNDPDFGSFWFMDEIVGISQNNSEYILTVMDYVGPHENEREILREERQIMLTHLGGDIYELNVLSPVVSYYLNFLNGKQFRKAETFTTPSHAIALYDEIDWDPLIFSYENEDDEERSWSWLFSGTLVDVVEYGTASGRNQRVRVRAFSHRSLQYAWVYARNLVEF